MAKIQLKKGGGEKALRISEIFVLILHITAISRSLYRFSNDTRATKLVVDNRFLQVYTGSLLPLLPLYMCSNIHHFGITKRKVVGSKLQVTPTKLQVTPTKLQVTLTKLQAMPTKLQVTLTKLQVTPTKLQVMRSKLTI